ncbi:MAG: transcriptional regulator [Cyclobacteriaceae bacterium]
MKAILTGDIVNSRSQVPEEWIVSLKTVLSKYGESPKDWEIFRGDSFQLLTSPHEALLAAYHIKAVIKQNARLDVRIAVGIGEVEHDMSNITHSNGEAYQRSGDCFDRLKKRTLGVSTGDSKLDEPLNLMLDLANLTFNNWSPSIAKAVLISLENPDDNQEELRVRLGLKSQSTVSESLQKSGFDEMMRLIGYCQTMLVND